MFYTIYTLRRERNRVPTRFFFMRASTRGTPEDPKDYRFVGPDSSVSALVVEHPGTPRGSRRTRRVTRLRLPSLRRLRRRGTPADETDRSDRRDRLITGYTTVVHMLTRTLDMVDNTVILCAHAAEDKIRNA